MTVATALAVSWKPLTNSKPSASDQQRNAQQREHADREGRRVRCADIARRPFSV
jgi:hypothetical protein